MTLLFDSNILIYHLNGELNAQGKELLKAGLRAKAAYSVISRIEVLGFQQSEAVEQQGRNLLAALVEIPLIAEIAEQAIALRKLHKIKLPDAVIAATALTVGLTLVTRNSEDFIQIDGLLIANPFEEI